MQALEAPTRVDARGYALAAGGVAVAAALRWVLGPALGSDFPLIFFLPPVVVAAAGCGRLTS
jgi:hypothetical protein